MVPMHLLAIEKNTAVFWCGAHYTSGRCKDDPSKFGCGKPVPEKQRPLG